MRRALIAGLLLAAALTSGCGAHPRPEQVYDAPGVLAGDYVSAVQTEPVPIAEQMEGQTGIVTMVVTDEGFDPPLVTAPVGGRVKLHIVNRGTREHTITIPRWGIYTRNLAPGEENYVEFTASEAGDWPFFSDAPGEPEPGLSGILRVE